MLVSAAAYVTHNSKASSVVQTISPIKPTHNGISEVRVSSYKLSFNQPIGSEGSRWGHQPQRWGPQPLIWQHFGQKLHENERNWTKRGAYILGSPSDQPLISDIYQIYHYRAKTLCSCCKLWKHPRELKRNSLYRKSILAARFSKKLVSFWIESRYMYLVKRW